MLKVRALGFVPASQVRGAIFDRARSRLFPSRGRIPGHRVDRMDSRMAAQLGNSGAFHAEQMEPDVWRQLSIKMRDDGQQTIGAAQVAPANRSKSNKIGQRAHKIGAPHVVIRPPPLQNRHGMVQADPVRFLSAALQHPYGQRYATAHLISIARNLRLTAIVHRCPPRPRHGGSQTNVLAYRPWISAVAHHGDKAGAIERHVTARKDLR